MFTLKQLNEKLGDARKRKSNLVNDRASKLNELETLMNADTPDQDAIEAKQKEINNLKADIQKSEQMIENYTDQIADLNDVQSFEPMNGGFDFSSGKKNEHEEIADFSFVKMFREAIESGPQGLTGLEKEMHQEAINDAKEKGIKLNGNLHVPTIVMEARRGMRNDVTVTGGSGGDQGGLTVQTDKMPLIDILKAKLPFVDSNASSRDGLGATFFTDLSGDLSFPRAEEDASDPAVKGETVAGDEMSPTLGELTLSPNRLPTFVEVSRQTLMQSSVAIENWLRNYLGYKIAKPMHAGIIQAILDASGTNAQAHGTDGGVEDWESIVKYETDVLDSDSAMEDDPRLAWLTNSKLRGKLKTTERETGTGQYLYDLQTGTVNNYDMLVSSLVPSDLTKGTGTDLSANIFANWASLYIAMWGGISFLVNPYSKDTEGLIRINAWTFYDSGLRHASAFSVGKDIITS
ncbi:MAG: phage major capsid protein [Balneola sp.]|nr:phage major capsid protein [Balneola sp.]|tara:strand:+ start:4687 stop:6072 length:1386 start_codon:yes stop_codon:yes gene_type:complete